MTAPPAWRLGTPEGAFVVRVLTSTDLREIGLDLHARGLGSDVSAHRPAVLKRAVLGWAGVRGLDGRPIPFGSALLLDVLSLLHPAVGCMVAAIAAARTEPAATIAEVQAQLQELGWPVAEPCWNVESGGTT